MANTNLTPEEMEEWERRQRIHEAFAHHEDRDDDDLVQCSECGDYLSHYELPDHECEKPPCPVCSGIGAPLGRLGALLWFRCISCGIDFNQKEEK